MRKIALPMGSSEGKKALKIPHMERHGKAREGRCTVSESRKCLKCQTPTQRCKHRHGRSRRQSDIASGFHSATKPNTTDKTLTNSERKLSIHDTQIRNWFLVHPEPWHRKQSGDAATGQQQFKLLYIIEWNPSQLPTINWLPHKSCPDATQAAQVRSCCITNMPTIRVCHLTQQIWHNPTVGTHCLRGTPHTSYKASRN